MYIETAYLLCPERLLDEFMEDPEYVNSLSTQHSYLTGMLDCSWNKSALGYGALIHTTYRISVIAKVQYTTRMSMRNMTNLRVSLVDFFLSA